MENNEGQSTSIDEGEEAVIEGEESGSEEDASQTYDILVYSSYSRVLLLSASAEEALARIPEIDIKGGWKTGEPCVFHPVCPSFAHILPSVPYATLAKTFSLIEDTTKRLEKTSILTGFFFLVIQRSAKGDSNSLLQAVYLCINRVWVPTLNVAIMLTTAEAQPRLCWCRTGNRGESAHQGD